jgi:hypothetical protein
MSLREAIEAFTEAAYRPEADRPMVELDQAPKRRLCCALLWTAADTPDDVTYCPPEGEAGATLGTTHECESEQLVETAIRGTTTALLPPSRNPSRARQRAAQFRDQTTSHSNGRNTWRI